MSANHPLNLGTNVTSISNRRWPTDVERDFLYSQAKEAASLSADEPYNAARAFLSEVEWLDPKAADLLAEQATARVIVVRTRDSDTPDWLSVLYQEHREAGICEERKDQLPA